MITTETARQITRELNQAHGSNLAGGFFVYGADGASEWYSPDSRPVLASDERAFRVRPSGHEMRRWTVDEVLERFGEVA